MSGSFYVGIDVSLEENSACFMLQDGSELVRRFSFTNNLPGATRLTERIK